MPEMKIQKPELKPLEEPIIEEDETESEAHDSERLVRKRSISSSNRVTSVQENHHQQQHHHQDATWDYFFPSVDSIPGPSLAEPTEMEEDVRVNKEQVQRKVFQERVEPPPMVVEKKVEKAVEVPVSAPEKKAGRKVEGGRRGVKGMNLMKIFEDLDDHFLKASESAHEVSKMLEATRLHYHSNFADNRGNWTLFLSFLLLFIHCFRVLIVFHLLNCFL
jgi:hypothetical protein